MTDVPMMTMTEYACRYTLAGLVAHIVSEAHPWLAISAANNFRHTTLVPSAETYDGTDPDVTNILHTQMHELNSHLRLKIGLHPAQSLDIRSTLVVYNTVDEWIRAFVEYTLPFMVDHHISF